MQNLIELVGDFNKANLVSENTFFGNVTKEVAELRYKLGLEELNEYLQATQDNDKVEIADALADQLYILLGTIRIHGLSHLIEPIFNEVHRSNMSKLDENGQPLLNGVNCPLDETRPLGKVLKSKFFTPPNILSLIDEHK